ncbi:CDP-glycerol glycerophosphotransferase family protein [Candidatus Sumerlaeota bacterium]|nr:CDP-glycerol glycerophosphotransferase family protein [Candidatus Sumerlaeota bacterium]
MLNHIRNKWTCLRYAHRRRLLFGGDTAMNFVSFRPVYDRLRRDPRLAVFLSSHLEDFRRVRAIYELFGIDRRWILDAATARRIPFDLFFTPIAVDLGKRARIKVKAVHGVSFKGKHYRRVFHGFDYLICPGPYLKRIYENVAGVPADDPRLVVTGFPKVDALVNGSIDRSALLKRWGLSPDRPAVLYAPTWSEGNRTDPALREEIVRVLSAEPIDLLLKFHDHERDWGERIRPFLGERARVIDDPDSTPCLVASDLLVSDASSVANEFTLLDRPIVFVDVPGLLDKYPHHRYDSDWGRSTGVVARTPEEVRDAVREGLRNPAAQSDVRRRVAKDLFFDPGRATERTVAKIYEWLGLDSQQSAVGCSRG